MSLPVSPLNLVNETKEQIKKSRWGAIISISLVTMVVGAILYYLTTNYTSTIFHQNELREGIVGQPRFLNPLFSEENEIDHLITSLVFRSLVKYDFAKKDFIGDLAEKYEIREDGKVYYFYLKDDIYFHDGEKLTMDDVLFTYEIIQHDNYHGYWKEAFVDVRIEKISDRELIMTLKEPLASFIEHNTIGIIPKHLFKDVNDALRPDHIFNVSPVGTGNFRYTKKELASENSKKIESLLLTNIHPDKTIKKIRFTFYDTEESLINAFKLGEIDSVGALNSSLKLKLKEWGNYLLITKPLQHRYYGLFFNLKSEKRIQDLKVRQAVYHALNQEEILKTLFPDEQIVKMIGPYESSSFAYDPDIKNYEFNLGKAKELLSNIPPEELKFTLTYPETGINSQTANLVKNALSQIGIDIELKPVALYNLRDQVIGPRNFELLLIGQTVFYDPDRYALWHSTQINYPYLNISQFKNRFADRTLEQGRKTTAKDKRIKAYQDFQRYFQNEIPAIMLYQPNYYYLVRNRFADKIVIEEMSTPEDRFNAIR